MRPDKCPWCLAERRSTIQFTPSNSAQHTFECGSGMRTIEGEQIEYQSADCELRECRQLWRIRMTLTEISWIARMIEAHDHGQRDLIGTGGDTAQKVMGAWGR